jgi:pimeloyl-ACP methyl ester carboxylesterase
MGERNTLETEGATLQIEDHNPATAGTALLFLHYWGGSAATWRKVIARLANVRCIAVSQRGWGGSTVQDGRYDLDSMAKDVRAIIARLNLGRVVLVGHSMGGKVSQVVAKAKPPEVCGLVLVAPAPPTPMPAPAEVRQAMFHSYFSVEGVGQALENLAGPTLPVEDREGIVADTLAGDLGAKREWTERIMTADLRIAPDDIDVPVTLVVGSLDKVEAPGRLRKIFGEAIPQTRFTEVPGIGHLLPLEAPEAVASACREMLAEVSGR